ncbi:MAG: BMP family ABC transporter substrate-binding protein [Oscillospiraceae bacterium]|nr:BMP family ABC transporter substrate-binding protein [Oscillospiraceae bacterium]
MKKLLALLLVLAMVAALFVGCKTNTDPTEPTTDPADPTEPTTEAPTDPTEPVPPTIEAKIAMVTDYGDITDESFNQAAYEGCKAFADQYGCDFKYFKPTSDSTADRVAMVESAIDEGYEIIVMPGYAFGGTLVEVTNEYPDVKFIALDVAAGDILEAGVGEGYTYNPADYDVTEYYNTENTYCAVYQEEIAGYMAGYAAVKLGYTKLGYLGGMAVPAVIRYGYGFVQGVDDAAGEIGAEGVEVKYVYGNQFFGDADITAYMDTWYADGTEAVFACGGGIYTSAAEAAEKVGGKVIGVDVDQAPIIDKYAEGMTITSAMKGLTATVVDALTEILVNDNWAAYAGQIASLGLVSDTDLTSNFVQLPASTQWADGFTEADYAALVAALFSGDIEVSNATDADPAVANITLDVQGNIK